MTTVFIYLLIRTCGHAPFLTLAAFGRACVTDATVNLNLETSLDRISLSYFDTYTNGTFYANPRVRNNYLRMWILFESVIN